MISKSFIIFIIFINIILVSILYAIDSIYIVSIFKLFEVYIILIIIILLYFSIKYFNFFHILVFFNITFIIFVLGKVPADLLNIEKITEFNSLISTNFKMTTIVESLLVSILSFLIVNLFSYIFIRKSFNLPKPNNLYISIGKKVMLFSFPLIFTKLYIEYKVILTTGYVAYFAGAASEISYPFPLIGSSHLLFSFAYFIFLAGIPRRSEFKLYSYIFIFIMLIDALKGSRGTLILPILFYFWFLGNVYKINIKKYIKIFIIMGIIIVSSSQVYAQYRIDTNKSFDYGKILSFMTDQGRSISLLSLYIDNKENMPVTNIGYIFEPLTFPFIYIFNTNKLKSGQNVDTVTLRENLNHRLTFYLNEGYYLNGGGLGSSYLAELYEFGYLGILIFSILLAYLISLIYRYLHKRIVVFFSFYIVTHIFMLGRTEYFLNMWILIKYVTIYSLFAFVIKIISRDKIKYV